jgi:hypothetical protein
MSIELFDSSAETQVTYFGIVSLMHTILSYILYALSMLSPRKYHTL